MPRKTFAKKRSAASAVATTQPNQTASLLGIAPELRNEIYAHVAAEQKEIVFRSDKLAADDVGSVFSAATANSNLGGVCKQLRNEYIDISIRTGAEQIALILPNFGMKELKVFDSHLQNDTFKAFSDSIKHIRLIYHLDGNAIQNLSKGYDLLRKHEVDSSFAFSKAKAGGPNSMHVTGQAIMQSTVVFKHFPMRRRRELLGDGKPLTEQDIGNCERLVKALKLQATSKNVSRSILLGLYQGFGNVQKKRKQDKKRASALDVIEMVLANEDDTAMEEEIKRLLALREKCKEKKARGVSWSDTWYGFGPL